MFDKIVAFGDYLICLQRVGEYSWSGSQEVSVRSYASAVEAGQYDKYKDSIDMLAVVRKGIDKIAILARVHNAIDRIVPFIKYFKTADLLILLY